MNQLENIESIRFSHFLFQSTYTIKSNEQRLKSIDQHEKEKLQRKRLIKDSLNNSTSSQHLKFDSDDEDNQGKTFSQTKLRLFDDNEEISNVDEHFREKNISKTEWKLKQLQTTNDPRFQLSEKFLDQPDDDQNEEISMEEEKQKSLAILDQMANGKSSSTSKSKMIRFDPNKTEHRIYELDSQISTNGHFSSPSKNEAPAKSILKVTKSTTPIL